MNPAEPNLLSHINDIRSAVLSKNNMDQAITTVIYCGTFHTISLEEAKKLHTEVVEEEVNKENVNITGILMGQTDTILHFLEGPCYSILRILTNLVSHSHFLPPQPSNDNTISSKPLQQGSIIFNLEDHLERSFSGWYSSTLQEDDIKKYIKNNDDDDEINQIISSSSESASERIEDIVYEKSLKLIELGKKIKETEELDVSKFADSIPSRRLVNFLSTCDLFFSIEDFVTFYSDPLNFALDSEITWPLERIVKYY